MEYLVSYADTDAGGVMHHARYIELAESSRHWCLRNSCLSFGALQERYGCTLVVSKVKAGYRKSVFLEDIIHVNSTIASIERSGVTWDTEVIKDNLLACVIRVKMVCVDIKNRSVILLPDGLIENLDADIGTDINDDALVGELGLSHG